MSRKELIVAIDSWLAGKHSPMAGFADFMVNLAWEKGVSLSLSVAIAQAETQCATDPNADPDDIAGHNAWGYGHSPEKGHGWLFPDWPNGVCSVTDWLAEGYIRQGYTTVESVCVRWVGSYSQPWIDTVSAVVRQFGGNPEKLARVPLMQAGEGTPPAWVQKL